MTMTSVLFDFMKWKQFINVTIQTIEYRNRGTVNTNLIIFFILRNENAESAFMALCTNMTDTLRSNFGQSVFKSGRAYTDTEIVTLRSETHSRIRNRDPFRI